MATMLAGERTRLRAEKQYEVRPTDSDALWKERNIVAGVPVARGKTVSVTKHHL